MRCAPAGSRTGKLLPFALTAVLLALAARGGGSAPPPSGGPPSGQPPPRPQPPGAGGFTPDHESVVAFPALLHGGSPGKAQGEPSQR